MTSRACVVAAALLWGCNGTAASTESATSTSTTASSTTASGSTGSGSSSSSGAGGNMPLADWSCLGHAQQAQPNPALEMHLTVTAFGTSNPLSGILVKVCLPADTACSAAVAMQTTDASGHAIITIDATKNPYLEFSGPNIMTTLDYQKYYPLFSPTNFGIGLVSPAQYAQLVGLLGAQPDPTRGSLGIGFNDCSGGAGIGATATLNTTDAKSGYGYFKNGVLDPNAKETSLPLVLEAVSNVPAGPATATGKVASDGMTIGTVDFQVRANTVTVTNIPVE